MDIFTAVSLDCYWEDLTGQTPDNQLTNIWGSWLTCNAGTGSCDRTRLLEATGSFSQAAKDACRLVLEGTSSDPETDICTCLNEFDDAMIASYDCPLDLSSKVNLKEMHRVCKAGGDPVNPRYVMAYGSQQVVQRALAGTNVKANWAQRGVAGCGLTDPFSSATARTACCLDQQQYPGNGNAWRSPNSQCPKQSGFWTTRMKLGGGNCMGELTYEDAVAACAAQNPPGRLCTQAEMEGSCSSAFGCGNDGRMNWTYDVCPRAS